MIRILKLGCAVALALALGACEKEGSSMGGIGTVGEKITGTSKTEVRGTHGQKLAVYKPGNVKIRRGEAETVKIRLHRENFSDPVNVSISQLPAGVEAVDVPRSTNSDSIDVVLRASDHADLVKNHEALVTAEGPEGIRATQPFKMNVREKS